MQPPSVLFKSPDGTVVLLDIPRSIEEAQVLPGQTPTRRLLSTLPLSAPLPTPEPKDAAARRHAQAPSALLADLMTGAAARQALDTLAESYTGRFCLPRITSHESKPEDGTSPWIPEDSTPIQGTVHETSAQLTTPDAPVFDLIVLDPPWPNRSAKRKRGGYQTTTGLDDTRDLLTHIPVAARLAPDGLVAVWITNRPSLADLLTAPGGVLAVWGLEVAADWTWLKTTASGEPMCDLESTWRKPWERIILARRPGSGPKVPQQRVIVAVPDLHSRKPALRGLFEDILPRGYLGLEVFARNLTAGWWGWGNEVLKFQQSECWVDEDPATSPDEAPDEAKERGT